MRRELQYGIIAVMMAGSAYAAEGGTMQRTKSGSKLTPMQEYVCIQGGTEKPFENAYWNHHEEGIYVDVIDGEPLFSSTDKFDSGSGWPSFTQPISAHVIEEKRDVSHAMVRTEVRSKTGNAHLGHVFPDGPKAKGGLRFCINSASLKFIPKAEMETAGYGKFLALFDKK